MSRAVTTTGLEFIYSGADSMGGLEINVTTVHDTQYETEHRLPEIVRLLVAAGHAAPSADNSQPWLFHWLDEELLLAYRPDDAEAVVFGTDSHCEHVTMGAVAENLIQAARGADLEIEWHFNNGKPDYLRGSVDAGASVPDALRHHSLFERHTNRLAYRNDAFPDHMLRDIGRLSEGQCHLFIRTDDSGIAEVADLVEFASRLRFRTREIHEWFGEVLRFSSDQVASGTGLDVATIELPPGGRVLLRLIQDWKRLSLLNRFGFYKLLARIEAAKVKNSAAIIAVTGPMGAQSEFAAGRLMERAWILLNSKGIAVQPFYVVTDLVRRLETNRTPPELVGEARILKDRLTAFLSGEPALHMLLRAGFPKREPVRSRRLPLERVYATSRPDGW